MGLRTFIAVELPEPARSDLAQVAGALAAAWPDGAVRWTRPEGIHLTLRFLGETEEGAVARLRALLDEVAQGARPLELVLGPVGGFPSVRRPRVIWVGLEGEGLTGLDRLQRQVEHGVRGLGWEREGRAFHPHLTLGRVRQEAPAPAPEWARAPVPRAAVPVRELVLVRSLLTPSGAEYSSLHRALLPT